MKNEQLWQAMGEIDEGLVTNTVEYEKLNGVEKNISKKIKKNSMASKMVALVAMIGIVLVGVGSFKIYFDNKIQREEQDMLTKLEQYKLVERDENSNNEVDMEKHPDTIEEAMEMSELVVRCMVESVGEPYYKSYEGDEHKEQYMEQEDYSSNIWQDCVLKVEEVYKGQCESRITYRFKSPKGYALEKGEEYVLFLEHSEGESLYQNSISPWYVRKKDATDGETGTTGNINDIKPTETESEGNTNSNGSNNNSIYSELPYTEKQVNLKNEFQAFVDKYYPYDDYDSDYYVAPAEEFEGITYRLIDVEGSNVELFAQYGGKKMLWIVKFENVIIYGYDFIGDDIIVYGDVYGGITELPERTWMARLDKKGNIIWNKTFDNGYDEDLYDVIVDGENINVITRVEMNDSRIPSYISLMQLDGNGDVYNHMVTDVDSGVSEAVKYKDSFYVSIIPGYLDEDKEQQIIKINTDGSYEVVIKCDNIDDENNVENVYEIKDMLVFNDKLYVSVNETNENTVDRNAYTFYEFMNNWADDGYSYFDEEALKQLNDNYTAKLLVYDATQNSYEEVYSVDNSLPFELMINDSEQLVWNIQTIEKALYSMSTSSYSVVTMNFVYEYIFDMDENLISNEKLKDAVRYSM